MAPAVIQPAPSEVFLASWAAVAEPVAAARALGPLPALWTCDFLDAAPVVQRAVLLLCGMQWGFVVGPAQHRELREAGLQVHGGDRDTWSSLAARPTRQQVERWRAQPGPLLVPVGGAA